MAFPEFRDKEGRRVLERAEAKASETWAEASKLRQQVEYARKEQVYGPALRALQNEAAEAEWRANRAEREVKMLRQMVAENMAKQEAAA